MAKLLKADEANEYLKQVCMKLGDWNQIAYSDDRSNPDRPYRKYRAPSLANELFCFSRHVAGWLPTGAWKILQIDNSASLDQDQYSLIGRLLACSGEYLDIADFRTWLFEFGSEEKQNQTTELVIANVLFGFLLFESHAYLVSSNSAEGELIGVQDGFVYFIARSPQRLSFAESLTLEYERNPTMSPTWVLDTLE